MALNAPPLPVRDARRRVSASLAVAAMALVAASARAAQGPAGTTVSEPPDAPTTVSVLTHDAQGKVVIRATRIARPLRVDGRLDDEIYTQIPPFTEFIQQEPVEGAPISERTEAWLLFDDRNIYVACRCWDEHPERIVANDMRRDGSSQPSHDHFLIEIDTFHDRRNGYMFYVTAAGGMRDGATSDEETNINWNGVWDGRAARFDRGWIAEMAIPFATLRYKPDREQTWGVQFRRFIAAKNERAHITRLSPVGGSSAVHRLSEAATIVGLEPPPPRLNLEIKPYVASSLTTDRVSSPARQNDFAADGGVDVKYGVTKGLTADFTYRTDFAQVEADEAQINLTRFNLSFPEKREFFLEGAGIFAFGTAPGFRFEPGWGPSEAPTIFYSRRIGLSDTGAGVVPVVAGGRFTGRAGAWGVGAFSMDTAEDPATSAQHTNFSVLRLRRDVLRRGNVGGIFTRRSVSATSPGANDVVGLDASFAFHKNVYFAGYAAKSRTSGRTGDDMSYRAQFNYAADRYGLQLDRLVVEPDFNPEIGFMRRTDFRRNFMQVRFSPRTRNNRLVRQWTYSGNLKYTTDNKNFLQSREVSGLFEAAFHNSDSVAVEHLRLYEFLPEPFDIASGVRLPVGGYPFSSTLVSFRAGQQHRVSGWTGFEFGTFYSGSKRTLTHRGRAEITGRLSIEPIISLNWIDLPQGRFTTTVIGGRTTFAMSPRMFVAALVQHSSSSSSLLANIRLRWEYQPGSEFFVVLTEGRSTLPPVGTELQSRGFAVKFNRLFRF